jgi:hypothetical protein
MTRTKAFQVLSLLVITLVSLIVIPTTVHAWAPIEPASGQPQIIIGPCTTTSQLDCIESIGALLNGSWVEGTLTGRTAPTFDGGVCCHEWQIPGLVNEDGFDKVESQATIDFPGTTGVLPRLQFEIHASTRDNFRVPYESGSTACTTNKINGVCVCVMATRNATLSFEPQYEQVGCNLRSLHLRPANPWRSLNV